MWTKICPVGSCVSNAPPLSVTLCVIEPLFCQHTDCPCVIVVWLDEKTRPSVAPMFAVAPLLPQEFAGAVELLLQAAAASKLKAIPRARSMRMTGPLREGKDCGFAYTHNLPRAFRGVPARCLDRCPQCCKTNSLSHGKRRRVAHRGHGGVLPLVRRRLRDRSRARAGPPGEHAGRARHAAPHAAVPPGRRGRSGGEGSCRGPTVRSCRGPGHSDQDAADH